MRLVTSRAMHEPHHDPAALAEAIAAADAEPILEVKRPKPLAEGEGIGAKARTRAQRTDIEQWARTKAIAARDMARRGHDTTVRVRHVDPATLRTGPADTEAARSALVSAGLRGVKGVKRSEVERKAAEREAARRRRAAARADARAKGA